MKTTSRFDILNSRGVSTRYEQGSQVIDQSSQTQKRQELADFDFPFKMNMEMFLKMVTFYSHNAVLTSSFIDKLNQCHDVLEPYIKIKFKRTSQSRKDPG